MIPASESARAPEPDDRADRRTYLLVLLTEAVVIAALYWLGGHFS